jgi:hypothetical protein
MTYFPLVNIDGTSSGWKEALMNNTGGTLLKGTPVGIDALGEIQVIDVSVESSILSVVGLMMFDTNDGAEGELITGGRLTDVGAGFSLGNIVFISKTGGITNVKPSIGVGGFVSGDYVVQVGTVAKNKYNPLDKDILIRISIVGIL